ncbi:hypothetical protein [Rufibacter sp. XAAS-G3-1]|uniref:hypothetical protein n=1 Tax=Rufibacter sp. XAAS-G3-1 TaxID=2729134 RepID=UPI0015E69764|nr:hypothetical protein [Rufibacter sp. XAAS-G3-1]
MLLYQDTLLQLEYDPATDILEITWPDLEPEVLPEIRQAFQMLVETIRNYDVKKLLVDGRKATINISDEENSLLMLKIAQELDATRLQKVARIESSDLKRETQAAENRIKIQHILGVHFEMVNFSDRTLALAWLKSNS